MLDPAFFDVVDVEPDVDDLSGGDELGDVAFVELLQLDWHFAYAFATHVIVPLDDLAAFSRFGILGDPSGNGFVIGTRSDEGFEVVGSDAREAEEEIIERAVEVILTAT